ncbi:hypothetical protein [Pseudoalteromonas aurantia]|uniref:Tail fiber protein n=1 Tax=Pseudoalteromonas aurantia 208 TaxID=1314867 RepID=A0ABR9E9J0_9GAMM|nr:hypothetical protein [Pseudoalteromonas aurantia]MBE0367641.1 hypothetical protein [Pseudoalteromonas aurantia 208]
MTIENGLTQLQVDVAELTDESVKLANSVTSSLATIDAVKGDIQNTHDLVDSNYQAMNDWQTKHGTVTFKNLQGQNKQVNTLSKLILDSEKINPNPHVMSKAQFDALRELRKQQYAGSGFVEWGRHRDGGLEVAINQGMYDAQTTPNTIKLGRRDSDGLGVSKAAFPLAVVGGVQHVIEGVNEPDSISNNIPFPPAPDGTKTYNSATGVVTEHASAAQAFEGLVENGDFRGDISRWANGNSATQSVNNGVNTVTNTTSGAGYIQQTFDTPASVRVEIVLSNVTDNPDFYYRMTGGGGSAGIPLTSGVNVFELNDVDTETTPYFRIRPSAVTSSTASINVHSVSIRPITESVITSRKDLVLLETWHEKIADKDIVFPLGNVQFEGVISEAGGVPVWPIDITFGIPKSYSAFGDWDSKTEGRGARWSTISESERKHFIDNPDNNIYFDSKVGELIQVRYRIRVIEGLGEDWDYPVRFARNSSKTGLTDELSFRNNVFSVKPKGMRENIVQDLDKDYPTDSGGLVGFYTTAEYRNNHVVGDAGLYATATYHSAPYSVAGTSPYVLPIALVQRMNQGAYHPSYNPMGTKPITNDYGDQRTSALWYNVFGTNKDHVISTSAMFDPRVFLSNSGHIGHPYGFEGRSDQYKYYDAIYAGQVEDLRLNANKLDVKQLREDAIRKAVAGEMRGKGSVPFTIVFPVTSSSSFSSGSGLLRFETIGSLKGLIPYTAGNTAWSSGLTTTSTTLSGYFIDNTSGTISGCSTVVLSETTGSENYAYDNGHSDFPDFPAGSTGWLVMFIGKDFTNEERSYVGFPQPEFDSLPWVDIIGDPERIAATFPDGVIGQWVPDLTVGTKQWQLNRKQVLRHRRTRTTDNGSTWVDFSWDLGSNDPKNTIYHFNSEDAVTLVTYESPSNFTEPSSNYAIVGNVGDVYASQAHQVQYGNRLHPSLVGKIGKRSGGAYLQEFVSVTKYSKYAPDGDLGWTSVIGDEPLHAPLSLDTPNDNSPAVKALSTVTEKDGLLYLQLHGAELKFKPRTIADMTVINAGSPTGAITKGHVYLFQGFDNALVNRPMVALVDHAGTTWNPSSYNGYTLNDLGEVMTNTGTKFTLIRSFDSHWGDDQVIPIVNGENVKIDLNGNTVKVFCHHTQIPLGIASN